MLADTLTLHLIDTVTGAVIESVVHKRVSGQIHVVHSENWVVYTCFNDKSRRFEVSKSCIILFLALIFLLRKVSYIRINK